MSRIGKMPIAIPNDAIIKITQEQIIIKGPLGTLSHALHPSIILCSQENILKISCKEKYPSRLSRALFGTTRALINNMIYGVFNGFEKKLVLEGIGYRVYLQQDFLKLQLGFAHDVIYEIPNGVTIETPSQTEMTIKGMSKQKVGQVAAEIRMYRSPEPYKGKGIRFLNEIIHLKETKKK